MKRILTFFVIIAAISTSCSKDANENETHLREYLQGTWKEDNTNRYREFRATGVLEEYYRSELGVDKKLSSSEYTWEIVGGKLKTTYGTTEQIDEITFSEDNNRLILKYIQHTELANGKTYKGDGYSMNMRRVLK